MQSDNSALNHTWPKPVRRKIMKKVLPLLLVPSLFLTIGRFTTMTVLLQISTVTNAPYASVLIVGMNQELPDILHGRIIYKNPHLLLMHLLADRNGTGSGKDLMNAPKKDVYAKMMGFTCTNESDRRKGD